MHCKHCDRLIDHNELICHYCNQPSRRRVREPAAKPARRNNEPPIALIVAAVVFVVFAAFIALLMFAHPVGNRHTHDEWWHDDFGYDDWDEWFEMVFSEPDFSDSNITLAELNAFPVDFGQPVSFEATIHHFILHIPREGIAELMNQARLTVEHEGSVGLVHVSRYLFANVELGDFVRIYAIVSGEWEYNGEMVPHMEARHIVPIH
ncbi:MAG: hypothetical protein FWB76_06390 [Oscillospiraceae bacterium]|nr:hypothetical protein [Oscillospiraceae bacterium]